MSVTAAVSEEAPLALVCGGGTLPLAVADHVAARGRRVVLFPVRGAAAAADFAERPHHWLYPGQLGRFSRIARSAGCSDVVFIGWLVRPALWQIRPDLTALMLLPRIAAAFRGGDDHLLTGVARIVEDRGFRLLGAHEVAPEILVPEGALTRSVAKECDLADIKLGLEYLQATSPFDVGQAVVVADRQVLATEAAEGTDGMLARVAELRKIRRLHAPAGTGVLVKAPKRGQDRRFDLPSIGPQTVENVVKAGLGGIAVAAGTTIIAEPEPMVKAADAAGVFVLGVPAAAT
jgi:DUF1009 family protein